MHSPLFMLESLRRGGPTTISICLRHSIIFPCWFESESITTGNMFVFLTRRLQASKWRLRNPKRALNPPPWHLPPASPWIHAMRLRPQSTWRCSRCAKRWKGEAARPDRLRSGEKSPRISSLLICLLFWGPFVSTNQAKKDSFWPGPNSSLEVRRRLVGLLDLGEL